MRYKCLLLLILLFSHDVQAMDTIDPELRSALEQAIADKHSFKDRFDAEVWLLDMSTRLDHLARRSPRLQHHLSNYENRMTMLRSIHAEARRAGLPPGLVMALIEVESTFDQFAISRSGAQGLMQIMPFWLKELKAEDDNLFKLSTNLRMGCTILKYYLDREKGNLIRGLARYNGSLGKTDYPNKVLKARKDHWY